MSSTHAERVGPLGKSPRGRPLKPAHIYSEGSPASFPRVWTKDGAAAGLVTRLTISPANAFPQSCASGGSKRTSSRRELRPKSGGMILRAGSVRFEQPCRFPSLDLNNPSLLRRSDVEKKFSVLGFLSRFSRGSLGLGEGGGFLFI